MVTAYYFLSVTNVKTFESTADFHRELATRRESTLAEVLNDGGEFRFQDGTVFRIYRANRGSADRLAIERVHQAAGNTASRAWHAIVDALWPFGTVKLIQRKLNDVTLMGSPIADKLETDIDGFRQQDWGNAAQALAICIGTGDEKRSLLPWLLSNDPNGPFQLDKVTAVRIEQSGAVVATFKHGASELDFCYHPDKGAQPEEPGVAESAVRLHYEATLVERDCRRMRDVLEGCYQEQLGAFRNPRELMQQFLQLRFVEEAHIVLDARARRHDERCGRGQDSAYLTLLKTADGRLVKDAEKAVELAVNAAMGKVRREAKQFAEQAALDPAQYRLVDTDRLDRLSRKAMKALSTIAATPLAGHSYAEFKKSIEREFGLTPAAKHFVKRFGHTMGSEARMVARGELPDRAAIEVATASGGELTVVRFAIKLPWYKALFVRRSKTKALAQLKPGETGVSLSPTHLSGYRGCVLWLQKFPDALRLHVEGGRHWKPSMAALTTETAFIGLDALYQRYHMSIYDNYLHEQVLPNLNAEVDRWLGACRAEMRSAAKLDVSSIAELPGGRPEDVARCALALAFAIEDRNSALADVNLRTAQHEAWDLRVSPVGERSRDAKIRISMAGACGAARSRLQNAEERIQDCKAELVAALGWRQEDRAIDALERCLGYEPAEPAIDAQNQRPAWMEALASQLKGVVSSHAEKVEQYQSGLRDRLDLLRIGKTTLGELNRWREAEFAYALSGRGIPASGAPREAPMPGAAAVDRDLVAEPSGADLTDPMPNRRMLRFASVHDAVEFAIREKLEGVTPSVEHCDPLPIEEQCTLETGSPILLRSKPDSTVPDTGAPRASSQAKLAGSPDMEYYEYTT